MEAQRYTELIERYLEGNLHGEELTSFKNELSYNTDLQNELSLEQDIQNGVKEFRIHQLKSNLAKIDVSTGITTIQKVFIGTGTFMAAVAISIGFIWTSNSDLETNISSLPQEIKNPNIELVEEVNSKTTYSQKPVIEDVIQKSEVRVTNNSNSTNSISNEKITQVKIKTTNLPPDISLPDENFTSETKDDFENFNNVNSPYTTIKDEKPEVVYNNRKKGLLYKFNNNTLETGIEQTAENKIQILQLNKRLYFCYKNKYYYINDTGDEFQKFEEINDKILISNLEKEKVH